MNMDFTGVDVFGDTTRMTFNIDTIGYPPTSLDTSMTVLNLIVLELAFRFLIELQIALLLMIQLLLQLEDKAL